MRDYAKVVPKFWTGGTGKVLRKSPEGALVALYLMTSPHSNMLGLFYQPLLYMAHETGLGMEGASKGLLACIEAGFCRYDADTEMVWVVEMASFQVASSLKPADKRCAGIQADYEALPTNPFLDDFFDRYCEAFSLTMRADRQEAMYAEIDESLEAPSKAHRSQEQEQEQEQENSSEQFALEGTSAEAGKPASVVDLPLVDGSLHPVMQPEVDEWSLAYPSVDVVCELRRMRVWLTANPRKRKTPRGINGFAVTWLGRQQDNPRGNGSSNQSGSGADPWAGAK